MSAAHHHADMTTGGEVSVLTSLRKAIEDVCLLRGDGASNQAALLAECSAQPPEMQADLLAHFEDQVRLYRAALNRPVQVQRSVARGARGTRP